MGFESISELSYVCFGTSSVFIINLLIAFVIFGILTLYLILFSRITTSLYNFAVLYRIGRAMKSGSGASRSSNNESRSSSINHRIHESSDMADVLQSSEIPMVDEKVQKVLCIVCVTMFLLPVLFKKSLKELKIQSQILFMGVLLLLFTFVLKQFDLGFLFDIDLP